jgi:hypothetical protein
VIFLLRFLRDTLAFHVLRTYRFTDIHRWADPLPPRIDILFHGLLVI